MTKSAQSVFVFGMYLALTGATLVLAPNALFGLIGLPPSVEVWPRVAGTLTLALAFFFTQAARKEIAEFFQWTVYVRVTVFTLFTAFALLGFVSPVLILFGLVDLAGAAWTAWTLRSSKSAQG